MSLFGRFRLQSLGRTSQALPSDQGSGSPLLRWEGKGGWLSLAEHFLDTEGVTGSNPVPPTISRQNTERCSVFCPFRVLLQECQWPRRSGDPSKREGQGQLMA